MLVYRKPTGRPAVGGVLVNRVASSAMPTMLQALRELANVLGALMRSDAFTLPERHLGLVMAGDSTPWPGSMPPTLGQTPLGQ
jgi:cobyrinic acid a,c-diamide synthase